MLIDVDYSRRKCVENRRSHEEEGEGRAKCDGDENTHVVADGEVVSEEHAVRSDDIAPHADDDSDYEYAYKYE